MGRTGASSSSNASVEPVTAPIDVVTAATEPVAVATARRRRRRTTTVRSSTSRIAFASSTSAIDVRPMASDGHSMSSGAL